jgi:hypothetical protein
MDGESNGDNVGENLNHSSSSHITHHTSHAAIQPLFTKNLAAAVEVASRWSSKALYALTQMLCSCENNLGGKIVGFAVCVFAVRV